MSSSVKIRKAFLRSLPGHERRRHFSRLRVPVTSAFTGKNLFRTLDTGGSCGMAKDAVYQFLNSVHTLLSSRVIRQELEPLTEVPQI
jgi:hypothetical protein